MTTKWHYWRYLTESLKFAHDTPVNNLTFTPALFLDILCLLFWAASIDARLPPLAARHQGRNHVFKVGGQIPWSRVLLPFYWKKLDRSTQFGAVGYIITLYSLKSYVRSWGVRNPRPPSGYAHARHYSDYYAVVWSIYLVKNYLCISLYVSVKVSLYSSLFHHFW